MRHKMLVPLQLVTRDTAPTNPVAGDMYFDTTSNLGMLYDGTSWVALGGGGGGGGGADDARYVNVDGDTMTGALEMEADLVIRDSNLEALESDVTIDNGWLTINAKPRGGFYCAGQFEVYHDKVQYPTKAIGFFRKDTVGQQTWAPLMAVEPYEPVTKQYADTRTPPIIVLGVNDPIPGGLATGTVIIRADS